VHCNAGHVFKASYVGGNSVAQGASTRKRRYLTEGVWPWGIYVDLFRN
jgi:hypothetical protein